MKHIFRVILSVILSLSMLTVAEQEFSTPHFKGGKISETGMFYICVLVGLSEGYNDNIPEIYKYMNKLTGTTEAQAEAILADAIIAHTSGELKGGPRSFWNNNCAIPFNRIEQTMKSE